MSTKCNYTYEKMKLVAIAMESRLVDKQNHTLEEAKMIVQDMYTLLHILANDKKLTDSLAEEGKKIYE